jgi:uncharacterized oxidoreductase
MKDSGNTVLITGGTSGIGYALAEAFLARGNEVLICARREERLREAQKKLPGLHVRVCDVAVQSERQSLVEWATSRFRTLNVLVNNAGIQRDIDFTRGIEEYFAGANEILINLEAPIVLSGMLVPHLSRAENAAIINISSGLGFVPSAKMPVYSATKAGLHVFSMALRHQLKASGIKVFEVIPPAVDTELNREGRAKRGGYAPDLKPPEFVSAVMKGLAADQFEIGYGMTERSIHASREEINRSIE